MTATDSKHRNGQDESNVPILPQTPSLRAIIRSVLAEHAEEALLSKEMVVKLVRDKTWNQWGWNVAGGYVSRMLQRMSNEEHSIMPVHVGRRVFYRLPNFGNDQTKANALRTSKKTDYPPRTKKSLEEIQSLRSYS